MRTITFRSLLAAGVVALAAPLFAQTAATQTTLGAALSAPAQGAPATLVAVASASGISVGTEIYTDKEAMLVQSVSGTNLTVIRGYDSTMAAAHASGTVVYAAPVSGVLGSPFVFTSPPAGSCTAGAELYTFRIDVRTGAMWKCVQLSNSNYSWQTTNAYQRPATVQEVVGAAIASAATITPSVGVHHVTGTTTINTITVPAGCELGCQISLIPDGLWSTGTSGNIALATTGVVSKAVVMTYDPNAGKWYPSY